MNFSRCLQKKGRAKFPLEIRGLTLENIYFKYFRPSVIKRLYPNLYSNEFEMRLFIAGMHSYSGNRRRTAIIFVEEELIKIL